MFYASRECCVGRQKRAGWLLSLLAQGGVNACGETGCVEERVRERIEERDGGKWRGMNIKKHSVTQKKERNKRSQKLICFKKKKDQGEEKKKKSGHKAQWI